jgi:glycosyltransferase involved in cell wall biosynthesis
VLSDATAAVPQRSETISTVVVSNGFGTFPLAHAARYLAEEGRLAGYITGAAVRSERLRRICCQLSPGTRRLAGRPLPDSHNVHLAVGAEGANQLAGFCRQRRPLSAVAPWLDAKAMACYARSAARWLPTVTPFRIYHYRAGFGLKSLAIAKGCGAILICDHSLPHPRALERLGFTSGAPAAQFWRNLSDDIGAADALVVNSEFAAESVAEFAAPPYGIHIARMGVEIEFLEVAASRPLTNATGPLRLCFAGTVEPRKGIDVLAEALQTLDVPWDLSIAGELRPPLLPSVLQLLHDPRVTYTGWVDLPRLAELMAAAEVFVFPSRAEGAARVIAEAMAAGCFVITTREAGSVVIDGQHGVICPAGDVNSLRGALRSAAFARSTVFQQGQRNRQLMAAEHTHASYGARLVDVYGEVLSRAA